MKRPPPMNRARPFTSPRAKPRSRPEAAAELTRIEYERDRLLRDLDGLANRRTRAELALQRADDRARFLREILARPSAPQQPKGGRR